VGGSLSQLHAVGTFADAACLTNDVGSTSWGDARPDPAPGLGYYYLVRAGNVCGGGTYGQSTGGGERLPGAPCP
jgi:hypothetical protein